MMLKSFEYFSIVLLTSVSIIYASYCKAGPGCCAFAGSKEKSCYGYGTSDVVDFFGYVFKGKTQYLIAGSYGGFIYVFSFYFQYQKGAQAIGRFPAIYAYCIQVPIKKSRTSFRLYCFEVSGCVNFLEVKPTTKGNVHGTDLPYNRIFTVAETFGRNDSCSQCQVLFGESYPDTSDLVSPALRLTLFLYMSSINAFRYYTIPNTNEECSESSGCVDPKTVCGCYQIESGCCAKTFVQRGFPVSGANYSCNTPVGTSDVGQQLGDMNVDFSSCTTPGGRCAFSQLVALIVGKGELTYFRPSYLSILQYPYNCYYQIDVLAESIRSFDVTRAFFAALC